jgi:hypothetical protein
MPVFLICSPQLEKLATEGTEATKEHEVSWQFRVDRVGKPFDFFSPLCYTKIFDRSGMVYP